MASVSAVAQENYESIYDEASQNFIRNNYEEALRLFHKANSMKNNTSRECIWRIAQTYSKLGAHKNVLQTCDKLIRLSGDNLLYRAKAWELLGTTLLASATAVPERPDPALLTQAVEAFHEFLKIKPEQSMAHYNLGVALAWINRFGEAVGEFQTYLKNANDRETARKARIFQDNPRLATTDLSPYFSYLSSDGDYKTSDELRGKVLLLNFWSGRNTACLDAIPYLSKLADKFKNDPFILIGVNPFDAESKWREYLDKFKMDWPQTLETNQKLVQAFKITNVPAYILIDHEGAIRFRSMATTNQLEEQIKFALKWAADLNSNPMPKYAAIMPAPPDPTGARTASIPAPKPENPEAFSFWMPKPVLQISNMEVSGSAIRTVGSSYMLRILNWASMPDELFAPDKNVPPCDRSAVIYATTPNVSRMELLIMSESGERIRSICGMPSSNYLQSLNFSLPGNLQPKNIYVQIKDRLTGNSVESDRVSVP